MKTEMKAFVREGDRTLVDQNLAGWPLIKIDGRGYSIQVMFDKPETFRKFRRQLNAIYPDLVLLEQDEAAG